MFWPSLAAGCRNDVSGLKQVWRGGCRQVYKTSPGRCERISSGRRRMARFWSGRQVFAVASVGIEAFIASTRVLKSARSEEPPPFRIPVSPSFSSMRCAPRISTAFAELHLINQRFQPGIGRQVFVLFGIQRAVAFVDAHRWRVPRPVRTE